jgi:hypothetical protein
MAKTFEEWWLERTNPLKCCDHATHALVDVPSFREVWNAAVSAEREFVALWAIANGFATGHGDTTLDLVREIALQVGEQTAEACNNFAVEQVEAAVAAETNACAALLERAVIVHQRYQFDARVLICEVVTEMDARRHKESPCQAKP